MRCAGRCVLGSIVLLGLGVADGRGQTAPERPMLVLNAGGHTAIVKGVAFASGGREVVSISHDKTVRVWDVATGELLRVLRPSIGPGGEGELYALAVSPDGKTLAIGGSGTARWGNAIDLIDLPASRLSRRLTGFAGPLFALGFSPDGTRLASAGTDGMARIWDVAQGKVVRELGPHERHVTCLAWAPDGARLLTTSDVTGRVWTPEARRAQVLQGHTEWIRAAAWRPDGRAIATGDFTGTVRLWDPSGRAIGAFKGLGELVTALAYTPDSRRLLATNNAGHCMVLDASNGRVVARYNRHAGAVFAAAISPDGTLAATGDDTGAVDIWKLADGAPVHRLASRGAPILSAGWSPDGTTIAWGTKSKYRSDQDRGPLERTFRLTDLSFAGPPDGTYRRSQEVRGARVLRSIDRTNLAVERGGKAEARISGDPLGGEWIRCFTWLGPDRVVYGTENSLRLFHAGGTLQRSFQGHNGMVYAVAPSPDGRYLLSASADQTLRIWSPDRDEPVLSLFFAGHDWIAWTPEGYYACSPGGERLMGWQINNGPDRLGTFHPASDFRKAFYRPDVIRVLLSAGTVARALEYLKETAPALNVAEKLPPVVFITSPDRSPSPLDSPKLEVRAVARGRSGQPITALRLLVDGRPYEGERGRKTIARERAEAGGEIRESWPIELPPGKHRLEVVAESPASRATSDPIEVNIPEPRPTTPRLFVLAIGIAEYPGPLKLKYAAADARKLAEVLRKSAAPLFERVEVRLVTDREASRRGIIAGLNWLQQQVTDRDVAVVFYSGHGEVDDQGVFYLIPADVDPADLAGTAVHGSQLKTTLAGMRGRVVVMLDACHAGATGQGEGRRLLARAITDDLARELASEDYGVVVMCSSTGRETSTESDSVRQGLFTAALVEGLSGRADALPKDGLVSVTELDAYVENRVKELSGDAQHPVTAKPASVRPFALTKP